MTWATDELALVCERTIDEIITSPASQIICEDTPRAVYRFNISIPPECRADFGEIFRRLCRDERLLSRGVTLYGYSADGEVYVLATVDPLMYL